jgi:ADP-ribosylglycohydrolase
MKEWAKERESGIYSYWECVESDNVLPGNRNMGWAKLAWTYAFISIKRNYNYEQAMRFVLKQAGDTDTNCAIVGGMVGARLGFKKLYEDHQELVEKFWNCKVDEYPQKRDKFFDPRNVIDYTMNIIKKTPSKLYYAGRLGEEEELRAKMANDL